MIDTLIPLLRCPLCGGALARKDGSLVCDKRHTYDIARQGYVNFVPSQRDMFYKKELFEHRAKVFEAGVFAPVVERLTQAIDRYAPHPEPVVLDAGCEIYTPTAEELAAFQTACEPVYEQVVTEGICSQEELDELLAIVASVRGE